MHHHILNVVEYSRVLSEVLSRVKPTDEEQKRILSVAERVVSAIRRRGGRFVDVVVAGSAARGTNLRGSSDVDVFLLYPRDVPREEMEREALEIGKSVSERYELRYAEHPYVTAFVDGVEVDVVPAYSIQPGEPIISATDRTPLHQRYVSQRLAEEQKDEVRLLKAFLKGIGVYGAEIRTEGFSGYLCELLIIHYGSFLGVLRAASRWRPPVFIDLEGRAAARFEDPLVVVDPVDPRRNVAAPVSLNSLAVFVAAAKEFLESPSLRFFFPDDAPLNPQHLKDIMLQRKTTYLFVLSSYPPGVSPDIVWGEIKRFSKYIRRRMEEYGYEVMNSAAWTDEKEHVALLVELAGGHTAFVVKRRGPPVFDRENSRRFLERHRDAFFGPYVEGGRWYVDVPRAVPSPEVAVYRTVVEAVQNRSVGRHVAGELSKGFEVVRGRAILPFYVRNRSFARWFSSFVVRRPPWLKR